MKTVMITGCSSGFGLETARYFLAQGWRVIATMRTPQENLLPRSENLSVLALDITRKESIEQALAGAGDIDVLVNNAGVGMLNALEGVSVDAINEVFATNTIGTMAVIQAILPRFRQRRAGVIINVTSAVTIAPMPLLSVYTASKAAINAFTESLALEVSPFNIRVGLVLPGRSPSTRFGENARRIMGSVPQAYAPLSQRIFASVQADDPVTLPEDVAQAIWQMANDPTVPMRLPAGADAKAMADKHAPL